MSVFPELHELIWLFEAEALVVNGDQDGRYRSAVFETRRGAWSVRCVIAPFDGTVTIRCQLEDDEAIKVDLLENVEEVHVDRTHGSESLVVICRADSLLRPIRMQLKPKMQLVIETVLR